MNARRTALAQGLYYAATGLWPFASMRSFLAVTGPKRELWLVKTVGALVTVVGAVLLDSARRGAPSRDVALLGAATAAALATLELVYVGRGRIAPTYAADAVVEAGLASAWLTAGRAAFRVHAERGVVVPPSPELEPLAT